MLHSLRFTLLNPSIAFSRPRPLAGKRGPQLHCAFIVRTHAPIESVTGPNCVTRKACVRGPTRQMEGPPDGGPSDSVDAHALGHGPNVGPYRFPEVPLSA
jgi:hypothetical protein